MGVKIIALTGPSGVGKDTFYETVALGLAGECNVLRISFSDELRKMASEMFPWLPECDKPGWKDEPFVHQCNPNNLTPRDIWKRVATCARGVQDNVFGERLVKKMCEIISDRFPGPHDTLIVVTDLRSEPEFKLLKDLTKAFDIKFVRIDDCQTTVDNCQEIDKPTFNFEVDQTIINDKDEMSKQRFMDCAINFMGAF